MPRTLYTTLFLGDLVVPAGPELEYTVPDGHIAIIRDISAVMGVVGLENSKLIVSAGSAAIFQAISPPGATRSVHWEGRVAAIAGNLIHAACSGDLTCTWNIRVTGYLLSV